MPWLRCTHSGTRIIEKAALWHSNFRENRSRLLLWAFVNRLRIATDPLTTRFISAIVITEDSWRQLFLHPCGIIEDSFFIASVCWFSPRQRAGITRCFGAGADAPTPVPASASERNE